MKLSAYLKSLSTVQLKTKLAIAMSTASDITLPMPIRQQAVDSVQKLSIEINLRNKTH